MEKIWERSDDANSRVEARTLAATFRTALNLGLVKKGEKLSGLELRSLKEEIECRNSNPQNAKEMSERRIKASEQRNAELKEYYTELRAKISK